MWQVRLALDQLSIEERDVVRLSWFDGLAHPEIAERLGVPLGTVKSRSYRAHKRLAAARGTFGTRTKRPPRAYRPTYPGMMARADRNEQRAADPTTASTTTQTRPDSGWCSNRSRRSLRSDAVWAEPPAGLEASIVERITTESPSPELDAGRSRSAGPARTRHRSWVAPALAAAAAVAAFVAGFLIADRDDDGVAAIAEVDLVGTELAPDASASGDVTDRGAGYSIRLDVGGLPPAAEGEYYEGWLRADDGEMVSVGTFHMRSGDGPIVLWSGVRIAEYHTLVITEELERSGEEPSTWSCSRDRSSGARDRRVVPLWVGLRSASRCRAAAAAPGPRASNLARPPRYGARSNHARSGTARDT